MFSLIFNILFKASKRKSFKLTFGIIQHQNYKHYDNLKVGHQYWIIKWLSSGKRWFFQTKHEITFATVIFATQIVRVWDKYHHN